MNKKRIVFFIESMQCGGAERSLLSLLSNLDSNRYLIDLLVINKGGEFEQFIPDWIQYHSVGLTVPWYNRVKFKILKNLFITTHDAQIFWRVNKSIIDPYSKEYDVAIAWGQGFATYYTASKVHANKKFAWVNIDYDKAGYRFKYDKNIYNQFDTIVGVSNFVKNVMKKYIKNTSVIHIRNIIDTNDIILRAKDSPSVRFEDKKLSIVSVGRLARQKAFELSVLTAKKLKEKEVEFEWYIIGEGTEREYLESLIKEYNLQAQFFLLGFRDNPYPYINACDMYVQTSKFEGLGRTLIEALILCKPIVTTNFPTAFNLVQEGETGFIVTMEAMALANKIQKLWENKDLYQSMVEHLKNKTNNEKQKTLEDFYQLVDS